MYDEDGYEYDFSVEQLLALLNERLATDEKAQLQTGTHTITVTKETSPNVTIHGHIFDQWRPRQR